MQSKVSYSQHDQQLKDLSAELAKFEAEYVGEGPMVKKAHDELISILDQHVRHWKQYHTSRFNLGRALFNYKALYTADRGWMVALEYIAAKMGRDPSTVRNIIDDYERARAAVPDTVIVAAREKGIDLSERKHSSKLEAFRAAVVKLADPTKIDEEEASRIVSEVMGTPELPKPAKIPALVTPEQVKQRDKLSEKISEALAEIPADQRLTQLVAAITALETEMFDVWGVIQPVVTVRIKPHTAVGKEKAA